MSEDREDLRARTIDLRIKEMAGLYKLVAEQNDELNIRIEALHKRIAALSLEESK